MPDIETILELRDVSLETHWPYDSALRHCSLTLRAGEMALVRLDRFVARSPLADVACGIVEPDEGSAWFRGRDWQHRHADDAALCRSTIGRIFSQAGWISNLDVDENITLAQRHHTHRRLRDIEAEALHLAKQFGLADLPRGRPHAVRLEDLRRAACIRAMMGAPKLLLLDQPTRGAADETAPLLASAVTWARGQGSAALWICDAGFSKRELNLDPTYVLNMRDGQLVTGD
jgi:phospholipid/cholesterol/gamma-HCH transport system ATP-binding protein